MSNKIHWSVFIDLISDRNTFLFRCIRVFVWVKGIAIALIERSKYFLCSSLSDIIHFYSLCIFLRLGWNFAGMPCNREGINSRHWVTSLAWSTFKILFLVASSDIDFLNLGSFRREVLWNALLRNIYYVLVFITYIRDSLEGTLNFSTAIWRIMTLFTASWSRSSIHISAKSTRFVQLLYESLRSHIIWVAWVCSSTKQIFSLVSCCCTSWSSSFNISLGRNWTYSCHDFSWSCFRDAYFTISRRNLSAPISNLPLFSFNIMQCVFTRVRSFSFRSFYSMRHLGCLISNIRLIMN